MQFIALSSLQGAPPPTPYNNAARIRLDMPYTRWQSESSRHPSRTYRVRWAGRNGGTQKAFIWSKRAPNRTVPG